MKYYFYRGEALNFGDELNHYLLPRILPNFFDDQENPLFLGIGSILFDFHPAHLQKIVFGSGYGGYTARPSLDGNWKIYSVRGPRTAKALGLEPRFAAADLAVLINLYAEKAPAKRFKVSFIPHFQSLYRGDWAAVAQEAGVNLIDPRSPVETVLEAIQASELVLAEAMHGAIVADALRVPWVALLPIDPSHRFKWFDWAEALDITLRPEHLASSSLYEHAVNLRIGGRSLKRVVRPFERQLRNLGRQRFQSRAAASLVRASMSEPSLSRDSSFNPVIARLQDDLVQLQREYA